MKTFKYYATILVVIGVLFSSLALGLDSKVQDEQRTLRKPLVLSSLNFDGNRIDNDLNNTGMIVSHLVSGRSGMSWPAGNGTQTIYASGVWLGAKVDNQVRVSAGEFAGELVGGPYGSDSDDPAHKLYKVSKSDLADPLASDDFQNWPAHQGAPFIDNNGNGTYEPLPGGPDHPDFIGDQVIWAVMNDGDPTSHTVFQTAPMGVEVQMTIFGFDRPDAFGDMMFVKELIINKGEETLDDMIIGLWSDPDLGDAGDDFVGCDTTLGMGIVYNDGADVNFAGYSGGTPAAGYDFFQGPMVPMPGETAYMFDREHEDMMNLKMTSFTKYINGDPVYYDPNNAEEAYNYMSGFMPDGSPFPFVASGGTAFVHPGDPTKDTGPGDTEYVDSDLHSSDDRRFLMNAGPFTMAPGDSQEVVFGIINVAAGSALESYLYLKEVDALAQLAYDIHFALPPSPPNPEVQVSTFADEIILSWDDAAELYVADDLVDKDEEGNSTEFVFEGYNVYQLGTASGSGDVKRIATYDLVNGLTEIYDDVFNTEFGETINRRVQFGSDSGIKRSISITSDALQDGAPLKTNRVYYFAVTAYGYNPYGIPRTLESPFNVLTIRPQVNTVWEAGDETGIYGDVIEADHPVGASDGSAFGVVVDPKALTGDNYEIFFTEENYYLDVDGVWMNQSGSSKERLGKILDCSGSTIDFSALRADDGSLDLYFNFHIHCGSNWVDGIMVDFPDGITINNWTGMGDFSYGSGAGQNCGNMDGTFDAATNSITWGDDARTGFGCIEGDQHWMINIDDTSLPFSVDYAVYDDGYDGTIVDVADAAELGYDRKTILGWYARNLNTGEIVTPHTTIQSGVAGDNIVDGIFVPAHDASEDANPIGEGLQFNVNGPALALKSVGVYANAAGPLDPPRNGVADWAWDALVEHDIRFYDDMQTNGSTWFLDVWPWYGGHGGEAEFIDFALPFAGGGVGIGALIPYDFEFRFTGNGMFFDNWGDGWYSQPAPFEVWNIGIGTPDDPSDDYKLITWLLDDDLNGTWGIVQGIGNGDDHPVSGATNDPYTDRVYVHSPTNNTPGTVGHDEWWAAMDAGGTQAGWTAGPGSHDPGGPLDTWNTFSRTTFVSWNGGDVTDPTFPANVNAAEPETGTVWRIVTTKPNALTDEFELSTAGVVGSAKTYDPDGINVWPNPYFGFNPEERDPVDQQIHFTNLPSEGECTIRIFDLAGVPVRTITHDNGTTLEVWNVKNDSNIPVASGMYIVVIETDEGQKILKIAIIQPEQRLDLYG